MTHIQVTHTQEQTIKIYKYELQGSKNVPTGEVLREEKVVRNEVMFSGSYEAWKIFKAGHRIPIGVKVVSWRKGFPESKSEALI